MKVRDTITNMIEEHELFASLPDPLKEIVKKRFSGKIDFDDFLNLDYEKDLHDPFLFKDMQKAVERILQAIKKEEKIAIYSDFDADGIPGAIVLKETFEKLGYTNFLNYIPHRNKEGYGLHKEAVEKLIKDKGVSLIITVDVGISDTGAAAVANKLGADLIITDHHEALNVPEAFAIINPKLENEEYPFKELCGAAVAWKLSSALLKFGKKSKLPGFADIKKGWEKWLLSLVALSTVADMMPLVAENRALVHFGLIAMQKSPRPGLRALLRHYGVSQNLLDETDLGFSIAPKINAASRLGDPVLAFNLLSSTDPLQIQKDLLEIDRLNKKRKTESAKISREAKKRLKARESLPKVFLTGDKSWNPALLGLSAGKLADEFGCIVCLWGQDEAGVFKGSCRNGNSGHIAKLLDSVKERLIDYGGHEGAGGFSLDFENLLEFEDLLNESYEKLGFESQEQKIEFDAELLSSDLNWDFYKKLRLLAPFGIANPAPIFRWSNIEIVSKRLFGKNKEHLEIVFKSSGNNQSAKAIAFFAKDEWKILENIKEIYGKLEKSSFMNKVELRISITNLG